MAILRFLIFFVDFLSPFGVHFSEHFYLVWISIICYYSCIPFSTPFFVFWACFAVDYAGGSYFTVKVVSSDGKVAVGGESVIFIFNGNAIIAKTDKNGIAKIKITQTPGKYTIKTVFNGKTYTNKITVKQVLKTSKVTVKKTAKKFTLKATLKINGKLVKGKTITFKFFGKTYKVKTNYKGIAQKTLYKNVIKKLKKGKTYTVKVTYLKDTIKTTVKVK